MFIQNMKFLYIHHFRTRKAQMFFRNVQSSKFFELIDKDSVFKVQWPLTHGSKRQPISKGSSSTTRLFDQSLGFSFLDLLKPSQRVEWWMLPSEDIWSAMINACNHRLNSHIHRLLRYSTPLYRHPCWSKTSQ